MFSFYLFNGCNKRYEKKSSMGRYIKCYFFSFGKGATFVPFCDVTCAITTFERSSYYLTYLVLTFPIVIKKLIFLVRTELLNWANLVKLANHKVLATWYYFLRKDTVWFPQSEKWCLCYLFIYKLLLTSLLDIWSIQIILTEEQSSTV